MKPKPATRNPQPATAQVRDEVGSRANVHAELGRTVRGLPYLSGTRSRPASGEAQT